MLHALRAHALRSSRLAYRPRLVPLTFALTKLVDMPPKRKRSDIAGAAEIAAMDAAAGDALQSKEAPPSKTAVSYTHLTLPTIYSV